MGRMTPFFRVKIPKKPEITEHTNSRHAEMLWEPGLLKAISASPALWESLAATLGFSPDECDPQRNSDSSPSSLYFREAAGDSFNKILP
jgi:hypothetical protein